MTDPSDQRLSCVTYQGSDCRRDLKQAFPHKLWVDIFSKADLLEEVLGDSGAMGSAQGKSTEPEAHSGAHSGFEEASSQPEAPGPQAPQAGTPPVPEEPPQQGPDAARRRLAARQLVQEVPGAVFVSSTTEQGLEQLKGSVIHMLLEQIA